MGLLDLEGNLMLEYEESKRHQKWIRILALFELLELLAQRKDETKDFKRYPKFGFEIECHLLKQVSQDLAKPNYQLDFDKESLVGSCQNCFEIACESGRWMLELIPKGPFEDFLYPDNLYTILRLIYKTTPTIVNDGQVVLYTPFPPKLGLNSYAEYLNGGKCTPRSLSQKNKLSLSEFLDDSMSNIHPRFQAFASNIRRRRQEKLCLTAPIYEDLNTNLLETFPSEKEPGRIYLDAMLHGMGLASLQVTFGVSNLNQARWLYDQYHVFTPLWLALSASMPLHKGKLLETDTRWNFVMQSVDDRNPRERRLGSPMKPRCSPISMFLSADHRNLRVYNDTRLPINKKVKKFLTKLSEKFGFKMDKKLIYHFSHLFIRENLTIFTSTVEREVEPHNTKLFEAIQSSNWNDVRLKPPPSFESNIGWRVEFRSMDVQLTAELSFLFCHSLQILSRLLIKMFDKVNFYIPISLVDENFERANMINAATEQKFYFRTNIFDPGLPQLAEMTLKEIFNGTDKFIGLLKLLDIFLTECTEELLQEYEDTNTMPNKQAKATFQFLADLSAGKVPTMASLIRDIIQKHPLYKHDSILSENLLDSLTSTLLEIQSGKDKRVLNYLSSYLLE